MAKKPRINIIKGLDRIILLLAILSLFFGFYLGASGYHDQLRWIPEYSKWYQDNEVASDKNKQDFLDGKTKWNVSGIKLEGEPPKFSKFANHSCGFYYLSCVFCYCLFWIKRNHKINKENLPLDNKRFQRIESK